MTSNDTPVALRWSAGKRFMSVPFFRMMGGLRIVLMVLVHAVSIVAAIYVAQWIAGQRASISTARDWDSIVLIVSGMVCCSAAVGLFSRRLRARWRGLLLRIAFGTFSGAIVGWILEDLLTQSPRYSLTMLLLIAACASCFVAVVRLFDYYVVRFDELFQRNVLVVGGGVRASALKVLRRRSDRRGFRLMGYVAQSGEPVAVPREQLVSINAMTLLDFARANNVDEFVIAIDNERSNFPAAELLECRLNGIEISELASFVERETSRVFVERLNPSWVIFGDGFRNDLVQRVSGRVLDIAVSLTLLAMLWPLMLITALLIMIEDGARAPIFYRQVRVGLFGRHFEMLKFRSMHTDAESDGKAKWAQADDDRITRVGSFMRRLRIDELPQLFNVLRGEMSVVGPRPERPDFVADLAKTIPYYHARHAVKPGLAGWAQLCYPYGASEYDAAQKLQFDLFYVKNHNFTLDLTILLHTFEIILFGRGVR